MKNVSLNINGKAQQIIEGSGGRAGFHGPPLIHNINGMKF
jgi:hypothetical protein